MYLHETNLGNGGLDEYSSQINQSEIANRLRSMIVSHFNNPDNFKVKTDSPIHGETYAKTSKDGSGWRFWPTDSAPSQTGTEGQKGFRGDITGEYGNYYRVPNDSLQQWIGKDAVSRLSQKDINNRISLIVNSELTSYLRGKSLSWIAANLQQAVNSVVGSVRAAINADGWFQAWGLTA